MCTHNYISMYGVCLTYMTYEMCYVIVCSLVCMFICVSASKKDMMFHVYTNFRVCVYIYVQYTTKLKHTICYLGYATQIV